MRLVTVLVCLCSAALVQADWRVWEGKTPVVVATAQPESNLKRMRGILDEAIKQEIPKVAAMRSAWAIADVKEEPKAVAPVVTEAPVTSDLVTSGSCASGSCGTATYEAPVRRGLFGRRR
jgi:hypothetical protein